MGKLEIEEVVEAIAAMMDGDSWCGESPYETYTLDDGRSVIITSKKTGIRYHAIVMQTDPDKGSDPAG
jgi:hypothetical protein